MSDRDPGLTNLLHAAQAALEKLLPKGVVCVLIIGRGDSVRVAKNVDEEMLMRLCETASGANEDNELAPERPI